MDPKIWGPPTWFFLHSITLNYPYNPTQQDIDNYKNFFYYFIKIIPCNYCKHNLQIHLQKYPIENFLSNKKLLVKWLFNIHNLTNKHLNKPLFTYKQFINYYKNKYQKKKSYNYCNILLYISLFILFIILIIIIFYIYKYINKNNYNSLKYI